MFVATGRVKDALDYIRPSEKTACIYRIINNKNGKSYIGLTCNFTNRMRHHAIELAAGKHRIHSMQADFDDGDNFRAEILHRLPQRSFYLKAHEYRDLESWYIRQYNTIENGYNKFALEISKGPGE